MVPTYGYEIGLRSQPLPGLTTTLALWQLKQDSELLFIGDAGTTEASRPSKRTGVEWLVQYVPVSWLAMDLALAYTRARFTDFDPEAGDRIPGAAEAVGSAGVTIGNLNGWFGSLRWRYIGARPLIEDNSVRSALSQFNGRVGYAVNQQWRVWYDFNIFNRKDHDIDYFYVSRLPEPAEGIADLHFHSGPRVFRMAVSAAY